MKKNYIIPEMATLELRFTSVLCASGEEPENNNMTGDNGNSFGAPGRKVF